MTNITLTLPQALERAVSACAAGHLAEAEQLCQRITAADPDFFYARHLLAVVQSRLGKNDLALTSYNRALALEPDFAEAHNNRGYLALFHPNAEKMVAELEDAYILVHEKKLSVDSGVPQACAALPSAVK
jgi:Tfp pilus assembly protein PilF